MPGALLLLLAVAGCSPKVARVANPGNARCAQSLRAAFEIILVEQGEKPEAAAKLAASATQALIDVDLGPRPFKLSSPTGIEYGFFFENEEDRRCLLRLVALQLGTLQYSDNVTFLATRPLRGCICAK